MKGQLRNHNKNQRPGIRGKGKSVRELKKGRNRAGSRGLYLFQREVSWRGGGTVSVKKEEGRDWCHRPWSLSVEKGSREKQFPRKGDVF